MSFGSRIRRRRVAVPLAVAVMALAVVGRRACGVIARGFYDQSRLQCQHDRSDR